MEYLNKEKYVQNVIEIFRRIYTKQGKDLSNFDIKLKQIDVLYDQYLKLQSLNKKAVQQKK